MEKSEARVAHDALLLLHRYGQGLWWHGLTRKMIVAGKLQQLVEKEGLTGIATDFTDWGRGLSGFEYNADLSALKRAGKKANEIRETLLMQDARMAADVLRGVYESTQAVDGYVCVDLSPYAMESGDELIAEATRVFSTIGRKNVMVKIPATSAGIVAFEHLIAKGVNVAVCGLMTPEAYRQVAGAYMSGLEKFVRRGGDPSTIAAVAEFPIAEIDRQANEFLEDELVPAASDACRQLHQQCIGRTAIATAYAAYSAYHQLFGGKRSQQWKMLAAKGARPQRLVFSQTGSSGLSGNGKRYIESLVGADTIIALSQAEIDGFGEQLTVQPALERKSAELVAIRERLKEQGLALGEHLARFQERQADEYIAGLDKLLGIIEMRLAELT